MAVILRYFSEIGSFRGALGKSSRSLESHLLVSSCNSIMYTSDDVHYDVIYHLFLKSDEILYVVYMLVTNFQR